MQTQLLALDLLRKVFAEQNLMAPLFLFFLHQVQNDDWRPVFLHQIIEMFSWIMIS